MFRLDTAYGHQSLEICAGNEGGSSCEAASPQVKKAHQSNLESANTTLQVVETLWGGLRL